VAQHMQETWPPAPAPWSSQQRGAVHWRVGAISGVPRTLSVEGTPPRRGAPGERRAGGRLGAPAPRGCAPPAGEGVSVATGVARSRLPRRGLQRAHRHWGQRGGVWGHRVGEEPQARGLERGGPMQERAWSHAGATGLACGPPAHSAREGVPRAQQRCAGSHGPAEGVRSHTGDGSQSQWSPGQAGGQAIERYAVARGSMRQGAQGVSRRSAWAPHRPEHAAAADACQRPLCSRCQARLSRSVRCQD
jgi:hypothetical protein